MNKKEELEKDWPKAGDGKKAAGLYITRPRKARKKGGPKRQKVADSDGEADDQKEEPDKSKKQKGKKKQKKMKRIQYQMERKIPRSQRSF